MTGKLQRSRKEIQNAIKDNGGVVASSVTSNTDYLICNDVSDSSKYKAAVKLKIKIINEEDFFKKIK